MIVDGEKACKLLFTVAAAMLGQDEYYKAKKFIERLTPVDEANCKRETEADIRSVLETIINLPESEPISVIHDLIMLKPEATRACFVCWLGEASEDLMAMRIVKLPSKPTVKSVLTFLLQADRAFWRRSPAP